MNRTILIRGLALVAALFVSTPLLGIVDPRQGDPSLSVDLTTTYLTVYQAQNVFRKMLDNTGFQSQRYYFDKRLLNYYSGLTTKTATASSLKKYFGADFLQVTGVSLSTSIMQTAIYQVVTLGQ